MGAVATVVTAAIATVSGAVTTRRFIVVAVALAVAPLQLMVSSCAEGEVMKGASYRRAARASAIAVRVASAGVPIVVAAVLVRTYGSW